MCAEVYQAKYGLGRAGIFFFFSGFRKDGGDGENSVGVQEKDLNEIRRIHCSFVDVSVSFIAFPMFLLSST